MLVIEADAFEFFNDLSGHLDVKLSEPAAPVSEHLMNRVAAASAQVLEVSLRVQVYKEDHAEGEEPFRELTDEEWQQVVLRTPRIRMRGEAEDVVVEHAAPDGERFTVRDLVAAVAETERRSRGASDWMGGVDVHHVFFEGIDQDDDGVWSIRWGS